ncbi:MAG: hypothetical protein K9N46_08440 [Candidatus Marinimicrobia bacterium]|nr:hypothetical protein [Candidatus Neomarinimicrobiota bacterium]MCF7828835.1 hypothetical protein [Candidatus Neomarinimicrobiota bacterium]MCF7880752.1 hypothetical protein [Candidatus Neomarinimicrobiota bacterium]
MVLSLEYVKEHVEANPDSPLFAYYADLLLQAGDTAGAYQTCSEGLEHYPEFATGWYIFGKISQAREEPEFTKTCWMKALSMDRMALQAAEDLLQSEDLDLSPEEIRSAAQAILTVDSEHGLARKRLDEITTQEEKEAGETTDIPTSEMAETSKVSEEGEGEAAESAREELTEELPAEEQSEKEQAPDAPLKGAEVQEEPEDFEENEKEEVPAEQSEDDLVKEAFKEAYKDQPKFQPPEFSGEMASEGKEEDEIEFRRPEFEPETIDNEAGEIDEPEDIDKEVVAEIARKKSDDDEEINFDDFDVEREEIESVMNVLRNRLGKDFDPSEISQETIDEVRAELRGRSEPDMTDEELAADSDTGRREEEPDDKITVSEEGDSGPLVVPGPEETTGDESSMVTNRSSIKITSRMATFTFANVLKSQGLYEQAYQVLDLMREKSDEIDRIEEEQSALEQLIEERRQQRRSAE